MVCQQGVNNGQSNQPADGVDFRQPVDVFPHPFGEGCLVCIRGLAAAADHLDDKINNKNSHKNTEGLKCPAGFKGSGLESEHGDQQDGQKK